MFGESRFRPELLLVRLAFRSDGCAAAWTGAASSLWRTGRFVCALSLMGFLVTEAQRNTLGAAGTAALPTTIMSILRDNHAR